MPSRAICVIAALTGCAAEVFLRPNPHAAVELAAEVNVAAEVRALMGAEATDARLERLEAKLSPMFAALPKNSYGRLGHATVRYALHRHFVQHRGWSVKGLEPAGAAWGAASPTGLLNDRVPGYVQGVFEAQLGDKGFGLLELALLAAVLEHLVHEEAIAELEQAYQVLRLSRAEGVEEWEADRALDLYMASFVRGGTLAHLTLQNVTAELKAVQEQYPAWKDTQLFTRDARRALLFQERSARNPFVKQRLDFGTVGRVVEKIGHEYGRFQDIECRQMKDVLLGMEEPGTGRVPLRRFHQSALDGVFMFQESKEYLRELGALDESDPSRPRVVVPNYIGGLSNCIATSSFYSVCCLDECEGLLGHLESQLRAPEAAPAALAAIVAKLPSSTVEAPRNLSAALLQRLEGIATNGVVQLHGRLFAQWMHHAFPRECPYPHLSSTTAPRTADEWMEAGRATFATADELKASAAAGGAAEGAAADGPPVEVPWTQEEELVTGPGRRARGRWPGTLAGSLHLLVPVVSFLAVTVRTAKNAWSAAFPAVGAGEKLEKWV